MPILPNGSRPYLIDKPAPPKPPKMRCVREDEPPRDVSGGVALFFFGFVIGAGLGAWWMM